MKAVLISIQPKWCELIASGKKTVEVRKTKPKLETPFKVYIYCTKKKNEDEYGKTLVFCEDDDGVCEENGKRFSPLETGKVIGEFVCNEVVEFKNYCDSPWYDDAFMETFNLSCVGYEELALYLGKKDFGYGWHISDLVIYEEPKALSEFIKLCNHANDCCTCDRYDYIGHKCYNEIKRPPQSWCYVEEG